MWQNTRALDKYDYHKYVKSPEISYIKERGLKKFACNTDKQGSWESFTNLNKL